MQTGEQDVSRRTGLGEQGTAFHESWYFPILIIVLVMIRLTTLLISLNFVDMTVAKILKPGKKKKKGMDRGVVRRQDAEGQSSTRVSSGA